MTVLRDTPRAVGLAVIGIVSAAAALALAVSSPFEAGQLLLAVGFGMTAALSVLAARQGVKLEPGGVRLRYPLRNRFLSWEDVVCFKVAEVRSVFGERLTKPAALLRTGDAVPLPGADRFSFLQRNAAATNFPVVDALERRRRQVKHGDDG